MYAEFSAWRLTMKHHMKFSHLFQGLVPILLCLVAVGGLLLGVQPASAVDNGPTVTGEICMQKLFGTPVMNSNRLNCTANDIRLSRAISVDPDSCTRGDRFDLTATFETIVTANSRYDAGFFFRIDGGTNARGDGSGATGECSLSALTPGVSPALPAGGTGADSDTCGDLNAGTYNLTFTIPQVLCQDSDGDGFLNLPNCTSWHSNQGTACDISNPFVSSDASDFHPDTKSKCVCDDTFEVPVTVEEATISVAKSASPGSVSEAGGTVTYTVQITNDASIESVTIATLVDDIYGNLHDPANPNVTDNSCPNLVGDVLAPGDSTSCSFKVFISGESDDKDGEIDDKLTDIVEVCATQDGNQRCGQDDAEVLITDAFTEPTLTKTAQSATCRVDVTYQVVVSNNSEVDELTVNTLEDDGFGNITTVHDNVLGTTCGVIQGAGTLQGQAGAGALPATIAAQGNYTCKFVGRIISNLCNFTHTNEVTGHVTDDDGITREPSDTATVTVTISGLP
jgi:hypothetical protein